MIAKRKINLIAMMICGGMPMLFGATVSYAPAAEGKTSGEANFSYSDLREEYAVWGTSGKETYDVAIRLAEPEMIGNRVAGFSVPLVEAEGIEKISVWMSKELTVVNKLNVPDIMSVEASIENDTVKVRFAEPYEIPEEGLYVGYSLTVTQTGVQATNRPIALTYGKNPDGFFFHSTRSQVKWIDKSSAIGGLSTIAVQLDGDFPRNGARLDFPAEMNVEASAEVLSVPVTFKSVGTDPIESLTFEYGADRKEVTMTFSEPWEAQFLFDYPLTAELPIELVAGMNYIPFRLSRINGVENPLSAEKEIAVFAYSDMLKKRPLVEEYTGLWCGWCPRGYVALERMAAEEEDFIGVAIHSGDDMQVLPSDAFPSPAPGLPTAWVDRTADIDPSYVNVKAAWTNAGEEFTYTAVEATADDNEEGRIKVETKVCFERPVTDDYAIFHYLLGNGLSYPRWLQTNYFSGRDPEAYPGMEEFIEAPEKVPGLVYNDVLLKCSDSKGLPGSLPAAADIKAGEILTNTYEFDLTDIISMQDFDLKAVTKSYSVVVGVVNLSTGAVSNAYKVKVGDSSVGELSECLTTISSEYFDLSGRRVSGDARGLLIERQTLSDGSVRSVKVMR